MITDEEKCWTCNNVEHKCFCNDKHFFVEVRYYARCSFTVPNHLLLQTHSRNQISDFKSAVTSAVWHIVDFQKHGWNMIASCSLPLFPHHSSSILSLIALTGNAVKHRWKTDGLFYLSHTHTYSQRHESNTHIHIGQPGPSYLRD